MTVLVLLLNINAYFLNLVAVRCHFLIKIISMKKSEIKFLQSIEEPFMRLHMDEEKFITNTDD